MPSEWFLASPEKIETTRVNLNIGLGSAIRYYNDLVAPGIGNTSFVRQFTWSCLAIRYANELNVSAIRLGNAIEALGLKAYFKNVDGEYGYRGLRAFSGSTFNEINSFKALSLRKNYVQNTYRQNTTRSLPYQTGIGLVESGAGFENYKLSPSGLKLIEVHEESFNGQSIERTLYNWVKEDKTMGSQIVAERFGPIATKAEKELILKRLYSDISPTFPGIRNDLNRRIKLMQAFDTLPDEWDFNDIKKFKNKSDLNLFLEDFYKAIDFYEVLNSGQIILAKIYSLLEVNNGKLSTSTNELDLEIKELVNKSKLYLIDNNSQLEQEAVIFCNFIINNFNNSKTILSEVVRRDQRVCMIVDGNIVKGPLYRSDIVNPEQLVVVVPNTLRNFYKLWKEVYEKQ